MRDLQVIESGALLIHNGLIRQAGPSCRVENLREARHALEICARGQVVMPSFVTPHEALVFPLGRAGKSARSRLEMVSKRVAGAYARAGILTVGAHTGHARDYRNTNKALRIHKAIHSKPVRIRSILAPRQSPGTAELESKWLPAIARSKLASVLDLPGNLDRGICRKIAGIAAGLGYVIRIRIEGPPTPESYQAAFETGAIAITSSRPCPAGWAARLRSCLQVVPALATLSSAGKDAKEFRRALDEGWPAALASGVNIPGSSVVAPQHILHLATTNAGMTAEESITAITWNAACALRLSHATASLEPGKPADLVILDVPDYRELTRRPGHNDILTAMSAGGIVYRRSGLNPD